MKYEEWGYKWKNDKNVYSLPDQFSVKFFEKSGS